MLTCATDGGRRSAVNNVLVVSNPGADYAQPSSGLWTRRRAGRRELAGCFAMEMLNARLVVDHPSRFSDYLIFTIQRGWADFTSDLRGHTPRLGSSAVV